jgi:tRNA modification GTPase
MKAPKTFTGQHVVEITCHNNQFLIERIIDRLIFCGARLAQAGEFTRRAVIAGKIDLIQAEAINDLISAQSEVGMKAALAQLEGSLSSWIVDIENKLVEAVVLCEASFEFLDEEMSFDDLILARMRDLETTMQSVLSTFDKQQYIKQGVRIALVGSTNAGKSSLFNALLNKNRAIVTDIEGTTRDTLEAGLFRQGMHLTLVDTAGLRQTDDVIERQGIDRSFEEVASADVVLVVYDASRFYQPHELAVYKSVLAQYVDKVILVQNKIDLGSQLLFADICSSIAVSAVTKVGLEELYQVVHKKINQLLGGGATPYLLNQRQYTLLYAAQQALASLVKRYAVVAIEYELLAHDLKMVLAQLEELTGKTVSEKTFDAVFRSFCVGK